MLGRELDLEDSTLTHIDHDIRGLKDKAFKVLMTWYERAPEATTKDKLVDALLELRRKDIADDIAAMEWRKGIGICVFGCEEYCLENCYVRFQQGLNKPIWIAFPIWIIVCINRACF